MRPKSLLYPALFALCPLLAPPRPARALDVYTITYSLGAATATQGGDTLTITAASGTTHNDAQGQPAEVLSYGAVTASPFPAPGLVTVTRSLSVTLSGPGIAGGLSGTGSDTASVTRTAGGSYEFAGGGGVSLPGGWSVTLYTPSVVTRLGIAGYDGGALLTVAAPAPEPAAWALWGVGAAGLGVRLLFVRGRRDSRHGG